MINPIDNAQDPRQITQGIDLPDPVAESLLDALRRVPERLARLEDLADPLHAYASRRRFTEHDARRLCEVLDRLAQLRRHYEDVERIASRERECPPDFDGLRRPLRVWQHSHALWSWRHGERELALPSNDPQRDDYEAAIAIGLAHLQAFTTMNELTQYYFSFAFERWLPLACGGYPDAQPLWHHIVREVAFWRRAQQLVADAVELTNAPDQ